MEHKEEQYLEDLVSKMIKEGGLEKPSVDFTSNLMNEITIQKTVYKPLISKTVWVFIILAFLALGAFLLLNSNQKESLGWFDGMTLSLAECKVSKTVLYATTFMSLLLLLQIPILKNYFDKSLKQ
ncbi:MAG: hypothetical protein HRT68_16250 [Flavobacteriaceae bacterium]|nr:hypothetical protein [Flavobacteriaceae bacterium]